MTYATYLRFYGLKNTAENRENWLANEHIHGRVYLYNGRYYSVETGAEMN